MRDIISGKPVIVIDEGKIDQKQLKSLNMSCEELLEQMRNLEYFDIGDINYAIVERSGKITIIPKSASMPATNQDMKIKVEETDIHYCILEGGKVIKRNFKELNLENKIEQIIGKITKHMKCKQKDLIFASLTSGGDVYAQINNKNMESFKISVPLDQSEQIENELSPKQEKKSKPLTPMALREKRREQLNA